MVGLTEVEVLPEFNVRSLLELPTGGGAIPSGGLWLVQTDLCFLFGLFDFVFSQSVSPPADLGRIDTLSEGVLRSGGISKTSVDICG